jgi:hypothetical protein
MRDPVAPLPFESSWLIRAAAALAPAETRAEWRREWHAELWWWLASTPDPSRLALAGHCWGAVVDAFWLRLGAEFSLGDFLALPSLRLAMPALVLVLVAAASGGFRHTRRALFAPAPSRLAVLSQTGPFMGKIMPLPSSAHILQWNARSQTIESVAIVSRTRALVRLRPGITAAQAEREWRNWNAFLQVTPYSSEIVYPLAVLGLPFIAFALVALLDGICFAPQAFSLAHPLAWLAALFLAAVELPANPAAILLPYLVASFVALRYCRRDRGQRCPVCLHRLGMPVRIGVGPRGPFEPAGTEFLCPHGHGALFTTHETEPESQWIPLAV